MKHRNFCIKKATGKLYRDKKGVVSRDLKNLPWFVVEYDFYPTSIHGRSYVYLNDNVTHVYHLKMTLVYLLLSKQNPQEK